MRLIYKDGSEVKVGDRVTLSDGRVGIVSAFYRPHNPASEGFCDVKLEDSWAQEFYVNMIGAKWIEREDRD